MSNWRDNIPVVPITQAQVDENLQCTICLDDFKYSEQVRRLDCAHVFHDTCIGKWLNQQNICPMCRRLTINREEVFENQSESEMLSDIDEDDDEMETDGGNSLDASFDEMSLFGSESLILDFSNSEDTDYFDVDSAEASEDSGAEGDQSAQPAADQSNGATINLTVEVTATSDSESSVWTSEESSSESESVDMTDSEEG